ncbi:MAG: hypothetical protein QOE70_5908 [Chthoniobacter sp.]|jgi:nucleotide-binding universal stress UspA family protein|nr:hypothetical protein [Chthoniobacter sp.]
MKTIVALVDFSDLTPLVIEQANQLAKAFQGRLVLLHAVPDQPLVFELGLASPTVLQHPTEKKIAADYQTLLGLRDSLAESGVEVLVQQIDKASAEKVLAQCGSLECDIIVMGAHHHSTLYHLVVGTFTSEVLKRAAWPVLVVPAPEEKKT